MSQTATLGNGTQIASQGVSVAGTVATSIGIAAHAAWVPVVGPIVAGVAIALALIFARQGPKQKIAASQIADQAEVQLRKNLDGYFSGPRTAESQAAALANFDFAWGQLTSRDYWGNPQLGEPGRRAIAERGRNGEVPGTGGNWYRWYRDPIADDTVAASQSEAETSIYATLFPTGTNAAPTPALLITAAVMIGAALIL